LVHRIHQKNRSCTISRKHPILRSIKSTHTPIDPTNSREIIQDIAGNLIQIGNWTLKGFTEQQSNITLFLKLTRKNINALSERNLREKFRPTFHQFCTQYGKLEKEYQDGIVDHQKWAKLLHTLANTLHRQSLLA
jgi:hypothetical protein